ncbi:MAG: hypothetical protein BAJATHORv1_80044 [Candidatus Thorarchaeota archaeon]|nr:MAG: hypothetical protein BAJATHORv1_80044 [Candidatus Thorarchaeota archaeon]
MSDPVSIQSQLRREIDYSIEIWKTILLDEIGEDIEYVYSKGSCIKNWDSPIDYVPFVSDVDIHAYLVTDEKARDVESDLGLAFKVSSRYKREFSEAHPDALHLPRIQFLVLNEFSKSHLYCPPKPSQVRTIIGTVPKKRLPLPEDIRKVDRTNLQSERKFLETLPMGIIDRVDLELWTMLRRFSFRVSPAPVRVITQSHRDPVEVWNWNRTKISEYLKEHGMQLIAEEYTKFYELGWKLFRANFEGIELYHEIFSTGTRLLSSCIACVEDVQ